MKEIPLSQGKVALVDDEDFELLNQWKWFAVKQKTGNYYACRNVYTNGWKQGKIIFMHRLILNAIDSKTHIDHKDHNGLNNQRTNIRIATRSQNQSNQSSHKDSISPFLGVTIHKKSGKWQAQIRKHGKCFYLGLHTDPKIAALAYNAKSLELNGEFANLNILLQ